MLITISRSVGVAIKAALPYQMEEEPRVLKWWGSACVELALPVKSSNSWLL